MTREQKTGYNNKKYYEYDKDESKMNRSERRSLSRKSSKIKMTKNS
tara:strand:- start:4864 stop:5001 length:138 start_codon:yes stop_codon:yes gene_type:complete